VDHSSVDDTCQCYGGPRDGSCERRRGPDDSFGGVDGSCGWIDGRAGSDGRTHGNSSYRDSGGGDRG